MEQTFLCSRDEETISKGQFLGMAEHCSGKAITSKKL
jgi:hypothetical protein